MTNRIADYGIVCMKCGTPLIIKVPGGASLCGECQREILNRIAYKKDKKRNKKKKRA